MPQPAAHRPFAADRSFTLGEELRDRVLADRYAVARSGLFELTARGREALRSLQEGWAQLEADPYYGGRTPTCYRVRRYSDFRYDPAANRLTPLRHVPYYQSEGMNRYVGGKVRHFGDVLPETYENPLFLDLVACDFALFPVEERWLRAPWTCQVHMIRIVVGPGESTPITPEGIHSDGYPFAGVHLMQRRGISGGESTVYTREEQPLATLTFEDPLDSLWLEDRNLKHYVTPISAAGPAAGQRDLLAISFSLADSPYETVL
jgi:hypothetical protein